MNLVMEILKKFRVAAREKRRWNIGAGRGSGARVFYGYDDIPGRDAILAGGMVKVQDLQARFPNCVSEPNILYIVSSGMPPYAPMMARIAKSRGGKVVVNQNGVAYMAWFGDGWQKANAPLRLLVQSADYVFYQSQFCKMAADRFLGPSKGGWEILHNPVDTSYFRPGPPLPRVPLVILVAGGHNHFYRVETAIRTLQELMKRGVNVCLLLAGCYRWRDRESDAVVEAEELARTLGVAHLLEQRGGYTQEEAVALFQSAHILLHTQYNDSCPRLVVEAMACGLPVVYSASGGVPELVGGDAGIGIPAPLDWEQDHPPVPEALANAVIEIAKNYNAFSKAGRERAVRLFDVKPWLAKHKEIFERLIHD